MYDIQWRRRDNQYNQSEINVRNRDDDEIGVMKAVAAIIAIALLALILAKIFNDGASNSSM